MADAGGFSELPSVHDWFESFTPLYHSFFVFSCALCIIVLLMTAKMMADIYLRVDNEYVAGDLYVLLSGPFIVCWISLVSLSMPRTSTTMYSIGLVYILFMLARVGVLMVRLFGGRVAFSRWARENGKMLRLNIPPMCCCCRCLPVLEPTLRNLGLIYLTILQSPCVRIVVQIATLSLETEGFAPDTGTLRTLDSIGGISTLIALYGVQIYVTMIGKELAEYRMSLLLHYTNAAQGFYTLLRVILNQFVPRDTTTQQYNVDKLTTMTFWYNVGVILTMTLLCLLLASFIRPGKSKFFHMLDIDAERKQQLESLRQQLMMEVDVPPNSPIAQINTSVY